VVANSLNRFSIWGFIPYIFDRIALVEIHLEQSSHNVVALSLYKSQLLKEIVSILARFTGELSIRLIQYFFEVNYKMIDLYGDSLSLLSSLDLDSDLSREEFHKLIYLKGKATCLDERRSESCGDESSVRKFISATSQKHALGEVSFGESHPWVKIWVKEIQINSSARKFKLIYLRVALASRSLMDILKNSPQEFEFQFLQSEILTL
jgi:hypothetical protein